MGILNIDGSQKGLRFDGVNDFVQTTLRFDISQNHSFAFWYKPNTLTGNQRILSTVSAGNFSNGGIQIGVLDFFGGFKVFVNIFNITIGTDNCSIYTTNSITNSFMHIVVVKDTQTRANWKIYINGVSVSLTNSGPVNVASGTLTGNQMRIGALDNNLYLNANLYDLKIFNKTLSEVEVTQLYNRGATPSNCIADYIFNNQSGTNLTDYVSGNNGTLNNYTTGDVTIGSTNKWLYDYSSEPFDNSRKNGVLLINNN